MTYLKYLVFVFVLTSSGLYAFQNDTSKQFKDSIRIEIRKLSDSLRAQKYYNASTYALRRLNDLKLSRSYADSGMYYAKKSGFKDSEAKSHFQFGMLERIEGNYEKALDHLDRNIKYFKNDSTLIAYSLFQVGVIHRRLGDYESSLKTYTTILNIFQKKKDSFAAASTLNSIGIIYGDMKNPDEAIANFSNALKIFKAKKALRDVGNAHENIGKMQLLKQDTLKAKEHIEKALLIARESKEDYQIGRALSTLGMLSLDSNLDDAFNHLNEARHLFEDKNYERELIPVYRDLGKYYQKKGDYSLALDAFQKVLHFAAEFKEQPYLKDGYLGLSELYNFTGDYEKAYDFQKKFITIKDSLFNTENIKTISRLQQQFETKKKDREIFEQKLLLAEQENEIGKKRMQTNIAIGLSLLLLILSVASWFIYKQRQKRKDQELLVIKNEAQINSLESLIEGEEKERLRIAKELHDGVNGDLSAIKHKLNTLIELNNTTIKEAVVMIDKSCEQVRAISHNLVPPVLENFDLQTAASDYCINMDTMHNPKINFSYYGGHMLLPKIIEVNLYRIIQELVTNCVKHANAKTINVELSFRNDVVQLSVEDDGSGFNINQIKGDGIGISNIKHRVAFLKGEVDFSTTEAGTSVTVFIDKIKF